MKFSFYCADDEYCDFLRKSDPCVPYTMDKKRNRPFVGIVFSINGYKYYAPLTSPKPKHLAMKNQIDFPTVTTKMLRLFDSRSAVSCVLPES